MSVSFRWRTDGRYTKFRTLPRYNGLEHDHIPAFASIRDAVNAQRAAREQPPLNPSQRRALKRATTTLEVSRETHRAGRTHSNCGGAERRAADAADLRAAAQADMDVHRPRLREEGHSDAQIDQWEQSVHDRNERIGLYDDEIPSSLWGEPPEEEPG